MDIIFYHPTFDNQWWIEALRKAIPQARVRAWKSKKLQKSVERKAKHRQRVKQRQKSRGQER